MFIAVFIISLIVYGLLVFYVGWSIYKGFNLKRSKWIKYSYILLLAVISISFILGRFGSGNTILQIVGNYWLSIFCILLLTLPFVHLMMLILRFTKVNRGKVKLIATITMTIIVTIGFTYGVFNAYTPKVTSYDVTLSKEGPEALKMVLITDTHFGYLSGKNHASRMVEQINERNADYIFISGDIIDDDLSVVIDKDILSILAELKSKYGTYAALGNHDRDLAGIQTIIASLEEANMDILYEETHLTEHDFYVVGRRDLSEGSRLSASDLLKPLDQSKAIIVLDHQPADLISLSEAGADMTLSGHTHHGQIFPGNLLTERLFPNDYGHKLFEGMHSIVSSGFGFWGPPMRIGSQAEIVELNLTFQAAE